LGVGGEVIAADLGLAKATVSYYVRRLGIEAAGDYVGRRAVVAMRGGSDLRASELCDVRGSIGPRIGHEARL
jgi:hypothetical protein